MIKDGVPSELAIGLFLSCAIGLFLGALWLASWLSSSGSSGSSIGSGSSGSSIDDRSQRRERFKPGRPKRRKRSTDTNDVQARSYAVQARSDESSARSDVQNKERPLLPGEISQEDIKYAMLAVYYRVNNLASSKEAAIQSSFPGSPKRGGTDAWRKASLAYDMIQSTESAAASMRDQASAAMKEVETEEKKST